MRKAHPLEPTSKLLKRNRPFLNPALVEYKAARKADFCSSSSEPGLQTVSVFLFISGQLQFWDWTLIPPTTRLKVPAPLTTKVQLAAMYYSDEKTKNIGSLEKLISAPFWFLTRLLRSLSCCPLVHD
jgi:hypothetical protein